MVVVESESDGNTCTTHDGSDNNEGVTKGKNVILPDQDVISINQDLELSDRRHDSSDSSSLFSSEDPIQPEVQSVGFTSPSEEEQKGSTDPTATSVGNCITPPMPVSSTTESLPPAQPSDASNQSSLLSIDPGTGSSGGDQALLPAASSPPTASVEPSPDKNVGQEKILEAKELPRDKMKQCAGNTKPTVSQSNGSHHSTGSESSSYSFAFPILVPGVPQRASRKTDGINPQGRVSLSRDEPYLEGENSISRPTPRPSSHKKSFFFCCCCCFPCHSIFSNCLSRSSY